MSDPTPQPTPGYRSTEFWAHALITISALIMASGLPDDNVVVRVASLITALLSSMHYTASRTSLKGGEK